MLRMFDEYVREEVVPFVWAQLPVAGARASAWPGMSLGAFYAANALLKHPDVFKRCYAHSGAVRHEALHGRRCTTRTSTSTTRSTTCRTCRDGWYWEQYRSCELRIVTGSGPFEDKGPSTHLAHLLGHEAHPALRSTTGATLGGHDWPYWKHQLREYLGRW